MPPMKRSIGIERRMRSSSSGYQPGVFESLIGGRTSGGIANQERRNEVFAFIRYFGPTSAGEVVFAPPDLSGYRFHISSGEWYLTG
mmetsp:Transcript_34470/g.74510  ORF Transcript_34470/g.74510 Transcript_34470/m.74510 type:complete len:86 (-) Transcript_34470:1174-1431(-)